MILYLDTSALLKPHLSEPDSGHMRKAMHSGTTAYTHLITYPEMRAALAHAVRMKRLSETDRTYQLRAFEADWASLHVVAVDVALARRAGEHAERFGLRGYASLHLAAAERVFEAGGRPAMFMLAAFDKDLCAGAQALGMNLLQ